MLQYVCQTEGGCGFPLRLPLRYLRGLQGSDREIRENDGSGARCESGWRIIQMSDKLADFPLARAV